MSDRFKPLGSLKPLGAVKPLEDWAGAAIVAEARLARGHHAGMVGHYARALRRARAEGGGGPAGPEWDEELLAELRHHRQRHRVFNQYIWKAIRVTIPQ